MLATNSMQERILVTGANGFVGRRLVQALSGAAQHLNLGLRASAPDLPQSDSVRQFAVGDIGIDTRWTAALEGCGTVVHLAAQLPVAGVDAERYFRVNDLGTRNLVEQARAAGVTRFVYVSSIAVLTENAAADVLTDEASPRAAGHYGESKLAGERHVAAFGASGAGLGISLRPPTIVGAEAKGNWALLQRLASSRLPVPLGSASNRRSFICVENLIDAIVRIIEKSGRALPSGSFNIADSTAVTMAEVFTWLRQGMKRPVRLMHVPVAPMAMLLRLAGKHQVAASLFGDLVIDSSRFQKALDWRHPLATVDGIRKSGAEFALRQRQ